MYSGILRTGLILLSTVPLVTGAGSGNAYGQKEEPAETTSKLEIAPYIKGGTVAWDQLEGKGGHKLLLSGGLNANLEFEAFSTSLNLEAWFSAEGMDDDEGIIPVGGYSATLGGRYYFRRPESVDWYLYGDLGYEDWDRTKTGKSWSDVGFFNVEIGVGVAFDKGIFQLGISSPFAPHSSEGFEADPRFGFSAFGKYRIFDPCYVGLFYDYQALEFEYLDQPYPDAKMTRSGVFVQYVF